MEFMRKEHEEAEQPARTYYGYDFASCIFRDLLPSAGPYLLEVPAVFHSTSAGEQVFQS